jgi:hypothetical protein
MTIYLVNQENELRIIPVLPTQESDFRKKYSQRILTSGETIEEVFRKFDEMPVTISDGI